MASILACLKSLNTCVLGSVLFTQWCELPRAVEMYYMENGGLFIYGSIQCVSVVTVQYHVFLMTLQFGMNPYLNS